MWNSNRYLEMPLRYGADSELSRNGAFKRAKLIGNVPRQQHPTKINKVKIKDQDKYTEGRVYILS